MKKNKTTPYTLNPIRYQNGQTLIETVVALFILITGISAGLTLAIYSFSTTADLGNRLAATGLAREGLEVVRRMRDSNWLGDSLNDCEDNLPCYDGWLDENYDIEGSAAGDHHRVEFDPTSNDEDKWALDDASSPVSSTYYQLRLRPGRGYTHSSSGGAQFTNFFRKVTIFENPAAPYNSTSPLLLVRSVVWWHGRNCPAITDYVNLSDTHCKVVTEEHLTNWKNY